MLTEEIRCLAYLNFLLHLWYILSDLFFYQASLRQRGCFPSTEVLHKHSLPYLIFLNKKPQDFHETPIAIGCSVSPCAATLLPYFHYTCLEVFFFPHGSSLMSSHKIFLPPCHHCFCLKEVHEMSAVDTAQSLT